MSVEIIIFGHFSFIRKSLTADHTREINVRIASWSVVSALCVTACVHQGGAMLIHAHTRTCTQAHTSLRTYRSTWKKCVIFLPYRPALLTRAGLPCC